jgi:hypothetical protein
MALNFFKQKYNDEVLAKAARSEHGLARMAHLNVLVESLNQHVSDFEASVGSTDTALLLGRDHVDNAAAIASGLDPGDLYHTSGVLKIVM